MPAIYRRSTDRGALWKASEWLKSNSVCCVCRMAGTSALAGKAATEHFGWRWLADRGANNVGMATPVRSASGQLEKKWWCRRTNFYADSSDDQPAKSYAIIPLGESDHKEEATGTIRRKNSSQEQSRADVLQG